MPQIGQKAVTVPEKVYARVRDEVEKGNEKNVAQTFVKAVEDYLGRKYEFVDELKWLKEHKQELDKLLKQGKTRIQG